MVASVKALFLCPKCGAPQSADEKPAKCPACFYKFRMEGEELAKEFKWEKSLPEQLFEMVMQDMERLKDAPLEELLPGASKEALEYAVLNRQQKQEIIQARKRSELESFLMKTNVAEVEPHVKTIHYLMTLAIPSGDRELVSSLAVWGRQIGEMAEVLQIYLDKGGRLYEHKKTASGSSESNSDDLGGEQNSIT